jgi:hypothetical protein
MPTVEQHLTDLHEQTIKLSAILQTALDKPRLDLAAMREQILCTPNSPMTQPQPQSL